MYRRGLSGEAVELVVSGGGKGLLAALPLVYAHLPVQRRWVRKLRNVRRKTRLKGRGRQARVRQLPRRFNVHGCGF